MHSGCTSSGDIRGRQHLGGNPERDTDSVVSDTSWSTSWPHCISISVTRGSSELPPPSRSRAVSVWLISRPLGRGEPFVATRGLDTPGGLESHERRESDAPRRLVEVVAGAIRTAVVQRLARAHDVLVDQVLGTDAAQRSVTDVYARDCTVHVVGRQFQPASDVFGGELGSVGRSFVLSGPGASPQPGPRDVFVLGLLEAVLLQVLDALPHSLVNRRQEQGNVDD